MYSWQRVWYVVACWSPCGRRGENEKLTRGYGNTGTNEHAGEGGEVEGLPNETNQSFRETLLNLTVV